MTLIETMVSAAIVGVGVISLANMVFFAEDGIAVSRQRTSALEMARARGEWVATLPTASVPQCLVVEGCRVDAQTYAPAKPAAGAYACSELLDSMSNLEPGTSAATTGRYRVDTVVAPHPDPEQQAGAQLLSVTVCWTDAEGQVQEVEAQRLLVPEI